MRRLASIMGAALAVILALAFAACGNFFVSESSTDHVTLSATALVLSSSSGTGTGVESKKLTATAVTVGGASSDVSSTATWTSSSPAIAKVDSTGTVTAVSAGTATISAKSGSATGTATVIVVASSVGAFNVTPSSATLHTTSGPSTQQLAAIVTLGTGTVDVTKYATWTSSATSVATVNSTGLVTGVANVNNLLGTASSATVTATIAGAAGNLTGTSSISVDSQ